jgi:hypothetical protein
MTMRWGYDPSEVEELERQERPNPGQARVADFEEMMAWQADAGRRASRPSPPMQPERQRPMGTAPRPRRVSEAGFYPGEPSSTPQAPLASAMPNVPSVPARGPQVLREPQFTGDVPFSLHPQDPYRFPQNLVRGGILQPGNPIRPRGRSFVPSSDPFGGMRGGFFTPSMGYNLNMANPLFAGAQGPGYGLGGGMVTPRTMTGMINRYSPGMPQGGAANMLQQYFPQNMANMPLSYGNWLGMHGMQNLGNPGYNITNPWGSPYR